MNTRWLAIRQLDQQLKAWQTVSSKYSRPRAGWVKTVRTVLCMSVEQLARRLNLSRSRIAQLEEAETRDAVTLHTLREVANAMECEMVYAIVPKNGATLESIIHARAQSLAEERVARVAHTMSLEAQSVDVHRYRELINELAIILGRLDKKLWDVLDTPKINQDEKFIALLREISDGEKSHFPGGKKKS